MGKDIQIKFVDIKTPYEIEVDGINYPLHQHNIDVVRKYESSKDEKDLDNLTDFILEIE